MTAVRASRDYLFYDVVRSVCSTCLVRCEGKLLIADGRVYMEKWCRACGKERVLIAEDADYWRMARERFTKHAEMPQRFQTPMKWGCPYDCGLCPDHQQHACLVLVEVGDACNLDCPICFASSGTHRPGFRPLAEIERMLDAVVACEGQPDVVQLSGGEPTIHPEFWAILDAAKARPIRHVMINTNGLEIARDPAFARRLATYQPGFEVYLQFDSMSDDAITKLRGARLSNIRRKALQNLENAGVSTTLVVTLMNGVNDHECGAIIEHALTWKCVRGVTFQPAQEAGRHEGFDPAIHRLTLTGVRNRILAQSSRFAPEDIVPVPCHPDGLTMAYAIRAGDRFAALTGLIGHDVLLQGPENTVVFDRIPTIRDRLADLFSTSLSPEGQADRLRDVLCCLPRIEATGFTYENVFRVMIVQFADARGYDLRSVKRCCIHFAQPDGKIVPFDTYNLFYRDDRRARLEELRALAERNPDV